MPRALLACAAVLAAALAVGLGAAPWPRPASSPSRSKAASLSPGGATSAPARICASSGKAHGELDPADPRNAVILDLDRAPRNARGMVEYATEFHLLRPADPARASGRMVHEVTNRGRKLLFSYFYDAAGVPEAALNEMRDARAVGSALPLAQGHVLLWNGWDPAAPRAPGQPAAGGAGARRGDGHRPRRVRLRHARLFPPTGRTRRSPSRPPSPIRRGRR